MTAAVLDHASPNSEPSPLHDRAAEQGVLGGMLLSRDAITEVLEILTSGAFYHPTHRTIFDTIVGLYERGEPADVLTVGGMLHDAGDLQRVGGVPYLHTLIESVPTAANAAYYARMVADHAILRNLDEAAVKMRAMVRSRTQTPSELVETVRTMVADLAGTIAATDGPIRWAELMEPALEEVETLADQAGEGLAGIPTGFSDLDRLLHGLQRGKVYVVAGESGSGKSTLAGDFVRSAGFRCKQPTLVFNLEMSRNELFNRYVCAEARVAHHWLVAGAITDDDWVRIARVCGDTAEAPLWIDDSPNLSVADIRVRAHKIKQQHGLSLIVVDLIGLVSPAQTNVPRQEQVAGISRKLKQLAKELDVAIIIVAQINRGPQQRTDKRPTIHDLRESAQIGHDADVVLLVFRPDQHDKESTRAGEADLIVDKNRGGPTDTVTVAAQLHLARFVDMAIL